MIGRAASLAVIAAAACGGPAVPMQPPTACPPALAVAPALLDDDGYRVELAWRSAATPDTPAPGDVPGYVIARLGLGPLPASLWLMRPDQPACQARIAGYRAEPLDDGVVLTARLDGCDGADAAATAWASLVGTDPTACRVLVPTQQTSDGAPPDAEAPADRAPADDAPADDAPADDVPLPTPWDARLPPPCDGCTRRWTLATIAGTPALGAVTALDTDLDAEADATCTRAIIAAGAEPRPLTETRGVALVGALADAAGTRVALFAGPTRWEVVDVDAEGRAGARRTVDTGPEAAPDPDAPAACAP
ncbi:MAG: hypothetical protein JNK64_28160 [Myxococcales bacterium]|nr:hypothetical protein [Myxococcales bacterium]